MKRVASALVLVLLTSGCATIARGTRQPVSFTTLPEGAELVDTRTGERWVTPVVVELERKHRHTLTVSKEGYRLEQVYVRSEVPFHWWLIDALTFSTLFDVFLGGIYDLKPADVHVVLERTDALP